MGNLPWFRFYTEARTDRKLDLLADDEYRVWNHLLCYSAEQSGKRGLIPIECADELAIECARGDDSLLQRTLSRLVTLKIIAARDDGWLFLHFQERQYDKPSDLPEATKTRQKVSRLSRDVTPPSVDVTPCHAISPLEESRVENKDICSSEQLQKSFNEWWTHYPNKVGKGAARKSFATAMKSASLHELIDGAERYRTSKKVQEGFICLPATWLNQERWTDEGQETKVLPDEY
jgi:hypothetical protein